MQSALSLTNPALLSSCGLGGSLSCHNTTVQPDLCCFNAPGGLILQTQFWDTNPPTGGNENWTIHGLCTKHDSTCHRRNLMIDQGPILAMALTTLVAIGRESSATYLIYCSPVETKDKKRSNTWRNTGRSVDHYFGLLASDLTGLPRR